MPKDDLDLTQKDIFVQKEEVEEVVFVGGDGRVKTRLRNKGGRFSRKPRPRPDGREVNRKIREVLTKLEADPTTGKITRESTSMVINMTMNIARIANCSSNDPKDKMAAVQAYREIMNRAFGTPGKTDEDKEDAKDKGNQGVKVVVIQAPPLPHPVQEWEDRPKPPEKPSFGDANKTTFLLGDGKTE